MSIWKRLKEFGPWSRARLERDLEREIQNHIAFEGQQSCDRRALGNIGIVKEDVREAWGWTRLEQFVRDIQYGLRQVRRNPRSPRSQSPRWHWESVASQRCSAPSMQY